MYEYKLFHRNQLLLSIRIQGIGKLGELIEISA